MSAIDFPLLFQTYKEGSLKGRYIHNDHINPILNALKKRCEVAEIGVSEHNLPIRLITIGKGPKKLLFWSQMHGNESTTTKAIFDLLNLLTDQNSLLATAILEQCTLYIVPILSPDGALAYTRRNFNDIDLNRDAQDLSQKESRVLNGLIKEISPDIAFNLHGQRTIFSTAQTNYPATVSFLSPAGDDARSVTDSRKTAMRLIVEMNRLIQQYIPNQVGRYDDGFNINCVGDTLTHMGIPAILFEAGHYPEDYDREKVREYIFYALVSALNTLVNHSDFETSVDYLDYFKIPENGKCFYDIIVRDVILNGKNVDIAIQYKEKLENSSIIFIPEVVKIENLGNFYGHREIIGKKRVISSENVRNLIIPGIVLSNFYLNSELFTTELTKS